MVKPVVQENLSTPPGTRPEAEFGETKTKILDAAFRRLAHEGYAALSVREIAKDAGVNHALINYHFRSKDQLVIAVLDEANRRLLERQQRMYAAPGGLRREVGAGAPLLRERPRLGLRAACRPSCGRRASPTRGCARSSCRASWRGRRWWPDAVRDALAHARGRGREAAGAVQRGGHRLLDLGVLDRHGVRRPARRRRASRPQHRAALDAMQKLLEHARRTRVRAKQPRRAGGRT